MSRTGWFALLLSLMAVCAAYLVADRVFERLPHLEDEIAFAWQAQVFARGELTVPSPPHPQSMFIPFVVDHEGQRFAKYAPVWSVVMAIGVLFGGRAWVNPLLAGLGIWLTYRLGQKIFSPGVGLLAAFLTLVSPFFLLLSGSLLAHPWTLVLSEAFALAWLDTFNLMYLLKKKGRMEGVRAAKPPAHPPLPKLLRGYNLIYHKGNKENKTLSKKSLAPFLTFVSKPAPRGLTASVAGLTLGLLALTRPLTALGVALPFFIHGLILLVRGDRSSRQYVLLIGTISLAVAALTFAWQYAVTGDPLLNPYTLWWPYDKIGLGPGYGRQEGGHSLYWAISILLTNLDAARRDLFGWGNISWLFLPFGLWAMRRNRAAWLTGGVFPGLAGMYMVYWVGLTIFGPRYYYEGLFSLTLISAAGIFWLAGWARNTIRGQRFRSIITSLLLGFLVAYNLFFYLPGRLQGMQGLYGVQRSKMEPFLTAEAQSLTPALVIVHIQGSWTDYGTLLELEDPWLTSPFIFAFNRGKAANEALRNEYPERRLIHYYPDEPYTFYDEGRR